MDVITKHRLVCAASLCLVDASGNAKGKTAAPGVGPAGPTTWSLEQEPRLTAEGVSWEVGQGKWKSNREEVG